MDKDKTKVGKKSPKKKGDYLTRLIIMQCVVCSLVFLSIFGISKAGGSMYTQLKTEYEKIMSKNLSKEEVMDNLKSVGSMVFLPMDNTEETTEQTTTEPETEIAEEHSTPSETQTETAEVKTVSYSANTLKKIIMNPVDGEWTSGFGNRVNPVSGIYMLHSGLDIAASTGTKIKAALDGKVTKADCNSANGNYIIMEHKGNVETMYCHCSKLVAKVGENIRQGETIALVGSTGNSTGPHLHFQIEINGNLLNPALVLAKNEV